MATEPLARKSAPADYYGERNTGIRLTRTGKIDEEAETARKALIRSMGKKPANSVNERWQPKAEPDQVQKLGSDGKILSSHSQYEQRRVSRIEARKAELEKLQADHEAREKEKAERISRRRSERGSSSSVADRIAKLSVTSDENEDESSKIPSTRQSAPVNTFVAEGENKPRYSHR